MAHAPSDEELLDSVMTLALEIARTAPDAADQALRIADLVRELQGRRSAPDRSIIHDVLEEEALDEDWSDSEVEHATDAIMRGHRSKG